MAEENQNIQVFVRSRPLNLGEKRSQLDLSSEKHTIRYAPQNKAYSFDNVFDANAKQIEVYRSVVLPLVDQVIEGYNCTVFAYGQTGTGKTFTMVGERTNLDVSWDEDPTSGMIPRAIDQLIDELASQNTEYTIRVSFLELYNEDAYDLLSPLSDSNKLRIYNDAERKGSVIISGLVEVPVTTKHEIYEILKKGSIKRATAPTLMNACSSRSHSIFSITVNIKEVLIDGEEVFKIGKLNLVDLAGSENIGRSGAVEERAREASNINKSLLTLGRVITSLVEKSPHIPYRDSKLTRLLQDSLGGKTKTSIIATISPGTDDLEDTLSTLDYAQRAKKITNKPEVNLRMSKKETITEYVLEIDRLRRDLEAARDKKGVYVDAQNYASMEATLKEQETNLELREAQIHELQKEVAKWLELLTEANTNLSVKCEEFSLLQKQCDRLDEDLSLTRESLEATKTEVENQKVLVESHQRTEAVLTSQASRILQVADKATDDNKYLFEKIDVLACHSARNLKHLDKFKHDFTDQMAHIRDMGVNIAETIADGYQTISGAIAQKGEAIKGKSGELASSFAAIQGRVEAFSAEHLAHLQQDCRLVAEGVHQALQELADFKKAIEGQMEACLAEVVAWEAQSSGIIQSLTKDTMDGRRRLEEKVMGEMSAWNEVTKSYLATIRSMQESWLADYQLKCAQLKKTQEELARVKASNSEMQVIIGAIKQNFSSLEDTVARSNHSLDTIADRLQEQTIQADQSTTALNFKAEDLANEMQTNKATVDAFYASLDQNSSEQCQAVLDQCAQLTNVQQQLKEGLKVKLREGVLQAALETTSKVELVLKGTVQATVEGSLTASSEQLTCVKSSVAELTAASAGTAQKISSLVAEGDQATLAGYQAMKAASASFHSSQQHLISSCTETCLTTDFESYQTTGLTPKKVAYEYPHVLAATSPHERILARHRENLRKEKATILENELYESTGNGGGVATSSTDSTEGTSSSTDEQLQQQQPEQSENLPPPCGDELVVADKDKSPKLELEQTFIIANNNNVLSSKAADTAANPIKVSHLDLPSQQPQQQQKKTKKNHGKAGGKGGGGLPTATANGTANGNRKLLKELNN